MRLVQLSHPRHGRKVALVQDHELVVLHYFTSVFGLAQRAISQGISLEALVNKHSGQNKLDYTAIYESKEEWQLLPSFDHPTDPLHCLISGTGLTHKASAENRQKMHQAQADDQLTDSMEMYQWGVDGGQPENGTIGVQPEWFYKGNGTALRAHGEALELPAYANDGGEEPEIAGAYIISEAGEVYRVGFTTGNEYSDHVMERKNYLYLAPSKLRTCAIGPELLITSDLEKVDGRVAVYRDNQEIWSAAIQSGAANMSHSLANLEYHHFKYANHRVAGQAHIHFYGADAFSFGAGVSLKDGDIMEVHWPVFGRPLRNTLKVDPNSEQIIEVRSL